uniref:Dynein regulatory complex subunit 4 n=1 Tax=Mola mola TaxID=94237 RepID=A0A3Q3XEW0_MOLML
QPPKKKGKGKSAKGKKATALPISEEEAKEQLENIMQLRKELDREKDERNYVQVERDRISSFWEITERQLAEVKAEQKNLDKEAEEDEGCHKREIKMYMQKLKYLRYEYHRTVSDLAAKGLVSSEVKNKEQEQLEAELHKEFSSILVDMQELDTENLVKELEEKHDEEILKTRNIWEKQLADIEAKYDQKMELLPKALDNMSKNILREREDHWNSHIVALIKDHNKALSETNALVSHMQHDVDINCSLQTQITDMKMKQKEKEKDLVPFLLDNKRLTDFLLNVEEEIAENEKKMKCYSKGLHVGLQLERDELYKSFSQRIQKVQHKGDVKNELLERKVKALTDSLEEMQAQLCSVLSASNMDQTALDGITNRIEVLNDSIKNLQYKKAQISKARKELLLDYESKQRALGVPVEDLFIVPEQATVSLKQAEGEGCPFTQPSRVSGTADSALTLGSLLLRPCTGLLCEICVSAQ